MDRDLTMEFVLNWMVLLLSLGGIVLVALMCYVELTRGRSYAPESSVPVTDVPAYTPEAAPASEVAPAAAGPYLELSYRRGNDVEHVQRIYPGKTGYIGTESYPDLGPGMPVRYVEIDSRGGGFSFTNLDWQAPVRVRDDSGTETEAPVGQSMPLADGAELLLFGGWIVTCNVQEGGGE